MKNNPILSEDIIKDIQDVGSENFEKVVEKGYKSIKDKEDEEASREAWREVYLGIIDILKRYCDLKKEYYPIVALWVIGTYFHEQFYTYPYLFLNAMKGSGKTRLLKLIKLLSKDGEMLNSLTEAVLFRTKGTLCIDEFEGITRTGNENLRELLNSAYKKGTKVKRMKRKRTDQGEEQVVEEFDVFRPIAIANIWGMEQVLGDRCITLIIEKSVVSKIIKLVEAFEFDPIYTRISKIIKEKCSLCSLVMSQNIYTEWNSFIINNYTTTHTNNYIKLHKRLDDTGIDGRNLELTLPLIMIANFLGEDIFDEILPIFVEMVKIRKEDEFTENMDVSVIDFVSQLTEKDRFYSPNSLAKQFKEFLQINDEWVNSKWIGRSLKRLNLIKEKKRIHTGIQLALDIDKAQEKIKMFK